MKMKHQIKTIVVLLCIQSITVFADGLPLNPGMWESTITTNNPLTGARTNTSQECN